MMAFTNHFYEQVIQTVRTHGNAPEVGRPIEVIGLRGYFVANPETQLQKKEKKVAEMAVDDKRVIVYAVANGDQ